MSQVGYLAAFLGGVLALLSPCSALLLPAFFAYAFQHRGQLLGRTVLFYAGLAVVLVPLGMGSSLVAGLFFDHRSTLVTVAGWGIIVLGLVQALGGGFAFGPAQRALGSISGRSPVSVLALGAVYGLAGFCSGPILGSILTVAAASGRPASGGALLAVYALGMTAPLLVMALVWDRFDLGRRPLLRGRQLGVGRLQLHTTSLISGALFVVLGIVFLVYDGTASLVSSGRLADAEAQGEEWVMGNLGGVSDSVLLGAVGAVALAVLALRLWRQRRPTELGEAPADATAGAAPSQAPVLD